MAWNLKKISLTKAFSLLLISCCLPILIGCPGKITANVNSTAPNLLQSSFYLDPAAVFLDVGQTHSFKPKNGIEPFEYSAFIGSGTISSNGEFLATTSGTAVLKVVDGSGAIAYATIEVTELPVLQAHEKVIANTVSFVTVEHGREPFFFEIVSGLGSIDPKKGEFIAPTTTGTTRIRVTDANGGKAEIDILIGAPLAFVAQNVNVDANGTVTLAANGGVGTLKYEVIGNGGTINSTTGEFTASASQGISVVKVSDSSGNIAYTLVTVSTGTSSQTLSVQPSSVILGQSQRQRFSVSQGQAPFNLTLKSGVGSVDSSTMEYIAPTDSTGTATIEIADSLGSTKQISIEVVSALSAITNRPNNSIEPGGTLQITPSGGTASQVIDYSFMAEKGTITNTGLYTSPDSTGTDVITVTDQNGYSERIYITIASALRLAPSEAYLQKNSVMQFLPVGGVPPYSFKLLDGPGTLDAESGYYKCADTASTSNIEVKDANGLTANSKIIVIDQMNVDPFYAVTVQGQSIDLTLSGGLPPYTAIISGGSPEGTIASVSESKFRFQPPTQVLNKYSQSIKFTDQQNMELVATIVVNPILSLSTGASSITNVQSTTIEALGGIGPYTFSIDLPDTAEILQLTSSKVKLTAIKTGTVVVTVKDSMGTEVSTSVVISQDYSTPPIAVLSGSPSGTNNTNILDVTVSGTLVTTYKFKLGPTSSTSCSELSGYSAETSVSTHITSTLAGTPDGEIKLCVLGKNDGGTWQLSALASQATWIKDTTGPIITVVSPLNNALVNQANQNALAVSGTCEAGQAVVVSGSASATYQCSGGTYSGILNLSAPADGPLMLSFTSQDSLANESTPVLVNLSKDTTAPTTVTISGAAWTLTTTSPAMSWTTSTDTGSGLDGYEFSIGTSSGATDTLSWTSTSSSAAQATGLSLSDGTTYYFNVKSKDLAGNYSSVVAKTFAVDSTGPTAPGSVNDGTTSISQASSPSISWTAATDTQSGLNRYEVAIGSSAGGSDVMTWTSVGNTTSTTVSGLSLNLNSTYYASVRAVDNLGNVSGIGQGNGWFVQGPPTITSISPTSGSASGGTSISISGTNFLTGVVAKIGSTNCTSTTRNSSTSITCVTPSGTEGAKNVVVTNSDTQSATLTNAFTYTTPGGSWTSVASGGPLQNELMMAYAWTGTKAIMWGQNAAGTDGNGYIYDPIANSWTTMSKTGAPIVASSNDYTEYVTSWTGQELIAWKSGQGALYNPATNTWRAMNTTGGAAATSAAFGYWDGTYFLVVGNNGGSVATWYRYKLSDDSWSTISTTNQPTTPRFFRSAIIGTKLFLYGGSAGTADAHHLYDSLTDTWSTISLTNAPAYTDQSWGNSELGKSKVVNSTKVVVWGGWSNGSSVGNGAVYNISNNTWTTMSTAGAPSARGDYASAVNGNKVIIWGGSRNNSGWQYLNDGAIYDVSTNTWEAMNSAPIAGRSLYDLVNIWMDDAFFIYGGFNGSIFYGDGAVYHP